MSPLSTTFSSFGSVSFAGLGASLQERPPPLPQLLPHSGDASNNSTLVPPSVSSFSTPSSIGGLNITPRDKSQSPLSLTVSSGVKGEASERKNATSPISLPPNKRIRIEATKVQQSHKDTITTPTSSSTSGEKDSPQSSSQNGCSFTTKSSSNACTSPTNVISNKVSANSSSIAPTIEDSKDSVKVGYGY